MTGSVSEFSYSQEARIGFGIDTSRLRVEVRLLPKRQDRKDSEICRRRSRDIRASNFPHLSGGLPRVLAWLDMQEFDSGIFPTTNLMHAGYWQFMRIHEGS